MDLSRRNQDPSKGAAYISFNLFFGEDHPLRKGAHKLKSFNNTISNVKSFDTVDAMRDCLKHWGENYDCTNIDDVHKFIKGKSVGLLARDFSERNTIMNSGLVEDKVWDMGVYTEICYDRANEQEAIEYICGEVPTCNFVGGANHNPIDHKKDLTAKADICFDEFCDEDVSDYLQLGYQKMLALCDAFLCKFEKDFYAFMQAQLDDGSIPKVTVSEPLTKHMIPDFLAELHKKLAMIPGRRASRYLALGNACTMKSFISSTIYDGNSSILSMNYNMSTGQAGTALGGTFEFITLNQMPDNVIWIGERNAVKMLRNSYMMYTMGNVNCGFQTTHTFGFKYGFSRSCQSYCNLFCIEFPAAEEVCDVTIDGEMCPEADEKPTCQDGNVVPGSGEKKVAEEK